MDNDLGSAVEVLSRGGLILYPTDTVWGIGCDATNPEAVETIYTLKRREDAKSMLILVDTEVRLQQYVQEIPEIARELIEVSDRPLTLIYPNAKNLARNLIAEDGSIGIRIPKDEFCIRLIKAFRRPVVSTSANLSGEKPPDIFEGISREIRDGVDYVVSWRQEDPVPGKPSSIIKLQTNGVFSILRH
ncbi:MAG: L-threonylcarbamoyladenylate synthase [Bacteroidales bacterium]